MKELMFQDQAIHLIEKNGKHWASAADIARALGYSRSDKVSRIFDRHRVEFSKEMTMVVETPTLGVSGNLMTQTRVFSLRGAHLIGMFARTKKAQEFRVWVLNILDSIEKKPGIPQSLMLEWFEAKAELDSQNRFASLCGRGLNEHKRHKVTLLTRLIQITEKMQPSLAFN